MESSLGWQQRALETPSACRLHSQDHWSDDCADTEMLGRLRENTCPVSNTTLLIILGHHRPACRGGLLKDTLATPGVDEHGEPCTEQQMINGPGWCGGETRKDDIPKSCLYWTSDNGTSANSSTAHCLTTTPIPDIGTFRPTGFTP